ncbi:dynein axonemal assembly factor 6-like [Lytechinus pictus]|uniref:dynein axonemal assembly factor 6-like n=1 Tax=Lytechinus pictus TaxID=7653 RepID=UPI00240D907C|nr:dynein axonemal assembly factor 6-like [Lytechinus pictus]
MEFMGANITALASLLKDEKEDESDDEQLSTQKASIGPGSIGPPKKHQQSKADVGKKSSDTKDIWDAEAVPEGSEFEDIYDPRPEPEYDIIFKQAVTSEDMFLQMGRKTQATSSCEDLVVKIKLPGVNYAEVELDVKDKFLDCRTPNHKLGLHLPHPVDSKNGKAKWDGDKEMLTVTLRMTREYDFVNF